MSTLSVPDVQLCYGARSEVAVVCLCGTSLVPRPHPLTWRNGLVNQVEFLGLALTFATL